MAVLIALLASWLAFRIAAAAGVLAWLLGGMQPAMRWSLCSSSLQQLGKNWSNHDLGPVGSGTGKICEMDDLPHDPKAQQVTKGYLNYIKIPAVLKDVRDHSQLNRNTPIITAGMGPPGAAFTKQAKRDAVDLAASIQFFRANGVDDVADDYGIHWYFDGNATPAARLTELFSALSECSTRNLAGSQNGDCPLPAANPARSSTSNEPPFLLT
jgi:hypothetical protein